MKLGGKVAGPVQSKPDPVWLRNIYLNRVVKAIKFEIPTKMTKSTSERRSISVDSG